MAENYFIYGEFPWKKQQYSTVICMDNLDG